MADEMDAVTPLDLDAIRERHRTASRDWHGVFVGEALDDIPVLIAEIERLRGVTADV